MSEKILLDPVMHHKSTSVDIISPKTSEDPSKICRNTPSWIQPCESAFNESDSSDWLSQSVASSTSWSDELDGEATKSLQEQLCLVENTLYRDGNQQLPAKSPLREECRLWQQNFPHLRILGEAIRPSVGCQTRSRQEEVEEQIEEIIAAHGDHDLDSTNSILPKKERTLDSNEIYKEKLKKAVIDQIFARIWPDVVKRIEPVLREAAENRKIILSDSPELKYKSNDRFDDDVTSGFNSLSIVEDLSLTNTRPRSGRSVLSARKNTSVVVPIKPVVLECSIPLPASATVRNSSAFRRSPVRLSQPPLVLKHPSPERLLSPLVFQQEVKRPSKSSGPRKAKTNERKLEVKHYPQYDAKTGRMISREDSRSGLRRNLKTSPPLPLSRHVALPPIETCEILPKVLDPKSSRSTSAFLKGGRLNCGSRPNTSLTSKNQVPLSPLEHQWRQTSGVLTRRWPHDQHTLVNCEVLQLKPSDKRNRWRNRSNTVRK